MANSPDKIDKIIALYREVRLCLRFGFALIAPPIAGIYLIAFTTGRTRLIGLGLLVYTFSLFVVLPSLLFAAWAKPRSNARLFAATACFVLAPFVFFYLAYASIKQDLVIYAFTILPISLLGLVFATWWARDLLADDGT